MEHKPIYVDGVDVSKCRFCKRICKNTKEPTVICSLNAYCKGNTNCDFKQLARKTQECEELREYHNKCCQEFEKEKQDLLDKYNQLSRDFYSGKYCNVEKCKQLDQLKVENETYKKMLDNPEVRVALIDVRTGERDLWQKYKPRMEQAEQKLERIANILFTGKCSNCEGYSPNYSNKELCNFKHNIKNIIDEVE